VGANPQVNKKEEEMRRRCKKHWNVDELIVIIDLYKNEGQIDGHHHDDIAQAIGRYNPTTNSHYDGAVNRKFGEIAGAISGRRKPLHPGNKIMRLLRKYDGNDVQLRQDTKEAWERILSTYNGPTPQIVQNILDS
jgi:hypothetical protein